ncbi:D-aminoacyl-tRNA deacylase [Thermoproteota archaeon]
MKLVIQRVSEADITINGKTTAKIGLGMLVLLGISKQDTEEQVKYLADKLIGLRIFEDEDGKMNKDIVQKNGEILIVSQFTLYADCKKGRRPGFESAAKPDVARPLYNYFISTLKQKFPHVKTGEFGADMTVKLVNDGPVTIIIEEL